MSCKVFNIFDFFLLIHSLQTFNSLTIFRPQMRGLSLKEILHELILWDDGRG